MSIWTNAAGPARGVQVMLPCLHQVPAIREEAHAVVCFRRSRFHRTSPGANRVPAWSKHIDGRSWMASRN